MKVFLLALTLAVLHRAARAGIVNLGILSDCTRTCYDPNYSDSPLYLKEETANILSLNVLDVLKVKLGSRQVNFGPCPRSTHNNFITEGWCCSDIAKISLLDSLLKTTNGKCSSAVNNPLLEVGSKCYYFGPCSDEMYKKGDGYAIKEKEDIAAKAEAIQEKEAIAAKAEAIQEKEDIAAKADDVQEKADDLETGKLEK